jgi:predicted hotdog family 3-hydroxylacyl-ACP dehydratase
MITDYSLQQVLPHAAPMILLDKFIEASAEHARASVTITADSLFYQSTTQSVPAYVGIEYMAQTIACFAGANELKQNSPVRVGYLIGCRKYSPLLSQFKLGTELTISAKQIVSEPSGLGVFDCAIYCQDQLIVNAKLNVFQPPQPSLTESE